MDLFYHPDDPISPVPDTPYICRDEWHGQVFLTYPLEKGKTAWFPTSHYQLGVPPTSHLGQIDTTKQDEVPPFLQTWLYFGMLCEFLGLNEPLIEEESLLDEQNRLVEIRVLHQEFTLVKDGNRLLTGLPLLTKLDLISDRLKQSPDIAARIRHLVKCLTAGASVLNEAKIDIPPSLRSSICVLWEILFNKILQVGLHLVPPVSISPRVVFGRYYLKSGGEIEAKMLINGWCPNEIEYIQSQSFSLMTLYALSQLKRPQIGLHNNCTVEECTALQINLQSYKPRHYIDSCLCATIGPDVEKINTILTQTNSYPVLRIKVICDSLQNLTVDAVEYVPGMEFVVLSHVWADGLGNPHNMALPRCQVKYLAECIERLSIKAGRSHDNTYLIWVDTLCCPVDKTMKGLALQRIANVYADAAHVLVLDRNLTHYKANTHPAELLLRIFAASPWMRRLWTLQEAALAKNLWVQLNDDTNSVNALLSTLEDLGKGGRDICLDIIFQRMRVEINTIKAFIRTDTEVAKQTKNKKLAFLQRRIHFRNVSVPSDEPLCIATLMNLNINTELNKLSDRDSRMRLLWEALAKDLGGISPRIVLYAENSMTMDGWRWAPQSLRPTTTTIESRLPVSEKCLRFFPGSKADGSLNLGQITPLGLQVRMAGYNLRAVPHASCSEFHPWPDVVPGTKNLALFVHNPVNDKWYRLDDHERAGKMHHLTKAELDEYDKQPNNFLCGKTHAGSCMILYDASLFDSTSNVCCLGQAVDHDTLDPNLLSQIVEPERTIFVRRDRTVFLYDNVGEDELNVFLAARRVAQEVAAHPLTASLVNMADRDYSEDGRSRKEILDGLRDLFKERTKNAWNEDEYLRRITSAIFDAGLGDNLWYMSVSACPHDLVLEPLPDDQTWIVD